MAQGSTTVATSQETREYADRLRKTSEAYAIAADATGLRKDAARYLYNESLRLHRESGLWSDYADELESTEATLAAQTRAKVVSMAYPHPTDSTAQTADTTGADR